MNSDSTNEDQLARSAAVDIYKAVSDLLYQLHIGYDHPQAPLKAVLSAAQALADASGYTVVLQVHIVEPQPGSDVLRSVGKRDVATAEPSLYDARVID